MNTRFFIHAFLLICLAAIMINCGNKKDNSLKEGDSQEEITEEIIVDSTEAILIEEETSTSKDSLEAKPDLLSMHLSDDKLFEKAVSLQDSAALDYLSRKGYQKAYSKLAKICLQRKNYPSADSYARKALAYGEGMEEANGVLEALDTYGYYDSGGEDEPD